MNQVSQNQLAALQRYLKPVPVPTGFTRREAARLAIEFERPPRIPYSFIDPLESDFAEMGALAAVFWPTSYVPKGEMRFDEWGVGWRGSGRLWGHPDVNPLTDLSALDKYRFPEILTPDRRALVELFVKEANKTGKYVVGGDPIMGVERLARAHGL